MVNGYIVLYNGAAHVATGAAYGVNGAQLVGLNLASTVHVAIGAYRDTWSFIDHTGNYNNASGTVADTIYGIKMVPTVVVTPTLKWFLTPEWGGTGAADGCGSGCGCPGSCRFQQSRWCQSTTPDQPQVLSPAQPSMYRRAVPHAHVRLWGWAEVPPILIA